MNYTVRETCRLCGQAAIPASTRVIDFGDVPLANSLVNAGQAMWAHQTDIEGNPMFKEPKFPLYLVSCAVCGHVQLPVVVEPERLFRSYPYVSGTSAGFRAHLAALAAEVKKRALSSRVPIVEIGSNDGTFIAACAAEEMAAIGVDPAVNLAVEAAAAGRLTVPSFFGEKQAKALRLLLGRDAMVAAVNVFAHADDLGGIADSARELIGRSGTFVIEAAYLLDVLTKNEIGTIYHEHVSHHHVGPLRRFFWERGLMLYDVERLRIQGGSIRCWVASSGRRDLRESERLKMLLEQEQAIPGLLREWPKRVEAEREATLAELAPYRGKGLAVYGAPARLVTYAQMLGLERGDVCCVFDDNPNKIGKFTPGQHWNIVAPAELGDGEERVRGVKNTKVEAILVASWNYYDEIRARHPEFKGKWILPRREA